jgi:type II secretory pathway pseudopilin PulG
MNPPARPAHQQGWSLVELAVGLVISALLTVLLVTLLPVGSRILDREHQQQELSQAEEALLGYARVHARMPAADSNGDGRADAGSTDGWLPVNDLALGSRMRIHYQVQPHFLQPAGDLFRPLLPPAYDAQTAGNVNGLDFCMRLLLDQRNGTTLGGLGMPVAYYLAHSGGSGQDRAEADKTWKVTAQMLPGSATTETVALAATGPGEFAARLSCPDRLARAQGSAQSALASYSAKRMADFNEKFRTFDVEVAKLTLEQAEAGLAFAGVGLAMAIVDEAIAITLTAAGWPPEGIAIGVGIGEHAVAVGSIIFAAIQVDAAEKDKASAVQGVKDAEDNLVRAKTAQTRIDTLYLNANLDAVKLEKAGLEQ